MEVPASRPCSGDGWIATVIPGAARENMQEPCDLPTTTIWAFRINGNLGYIYRRKAIEQKKNPQHLSIIFFRANSVRLGVSGFCAVYTIIDLPPCANRNNLANVRQWTIQPVVSRWNSMMRLFLIVGNCEVGLSLVCSEVVRKSHAQS